MRGSSLGYLFKEGARNVWVNRLMSLASIGVLIACMLLIGSSVLLSVNMNNVVGYVEDQNEVVIVLEDDMDQSELDELDDELHDIENINNIVFVSKEEAFQNEKDKLGDAAELLREDDNFYPNTYRIKIDDLEFLDETVDEIGRLFGVEDVKAPTDIAETLTSVKKLVITMGMGIVALLIGVTLIIIANTIKITVFNRRKEISIMKYVGATDLFIKLPFMIEGLILGLISAIMAYFILWGGYSYLLSWLEENPSTWIQSMYGSILPFKEIGLKLFGGFALGGTGLGVIGSMIFVRNYLKV
ncbi:ABC transporter permease [Clostridiaceae bacterium NSJ-31]|uniref:Cell division protein FtsX n=1 Tax=Ligaoa zhengdingensis TaxID=2763658 RepID=A0A926DX78_9FIRM|nr:permease-like cell division protein FtsX [Ligaoa zhengdingensis]MBC8545756.1 ABC transporter permease [Ligaoa zhengdingensis]